MAVLKAMRKQRERGYIWGTVCLARNKAGTLVSIDGGSLMLGWVLSATGDGVWASIAGGFNMDTGGLSENGKQDKGKPASSTCTFSSNSSFAPALWFWYDLLVKSPWPWLQGRAQVPGVDNQNVISLASDPSRGYLVTQAQTESAFPRILETPFALWLSGIHSCTRPYSQPRGEAQENKADRKGREKQWKKRWESTWSLTERRECPSAFQFLWAWGPEELLYCS